MLYKEICGNHDRQFWYTSTEDAKSIGIDEHSPICDPFKASFTRTLFQCWLLQEELQPNTDTLTKLALLLNEMIHNKTTLGEVELAKPENGTASSATEALPSMINADSVVEPVTIAAVPSADGHVTHHDFSWQATNGVDTTDASPLGSAVENRPLGYESSML